MVETPPRNLQYYCGVVKSELNECVKLYKIGLLQLAPDYQHINQAEEDDPVAPSMLESCCQDLSSTNRIAKNALLEIIEEHGANQDSKNLMRAATDALAEVAGARRKMDRVRLEKPSDLGDVKTKLFSGYIMMCNDRLHGFPRVSKMAEHCGNAAAAVVAAKGRMEEHKLNSAIKIREGIGFFQGQATVSVDGLAGTDFSREKIENQLVEAEELLHEQRDDSEDQDCVRRALRKVLDVQKMARVHNLTEAGANFHSEGFFLCIHEAVVALTVLHRDFCNLFGGTSTIYSSKEYILLRFPHNGTDMHGPGVRETIFCFLPKGQEYKNYLDSAMIACNRKARRARKALEDQKIGFDFGEGVPILQEATHELFCIHEEYKHLLMDDPSPWLVEWHQKKVSAEQFVNLMNFRNSVRAAGVWVDICLEKESFDKATAGLNHTDIMHMGAVLESVKEELTDAHVTPLAASYAYVSLCAVLCAVMVMFRERGETEQGGGEWFQQLERAREIVWDATGLIDDGRYRSVP